MEYIEVEEKEDMVEEEEAQSSATIVACKDIWPEIANYLPRYIVTIENFRTMSYKNVPSSFLNGKPKGLKTLMC